MTRRWCMLDEPTNGLDPAGREDMLGLIRRIGNEFNISVLVTSHLLGELERVCDSVVVIDAGVLLRYSSTAAMTTEMAVVVVEVDGDPAGLAELLAEQGVTVRAAGRLIELDLPDDAVLDLVRDSAARLDVGLVRMERQRHRMAEMFETAAGGAHVHVG